MPDGVDQVIDTAVAMGIPRDAPGLDPNLSMVLGSATISPIDMANAYGTIAAGGLAKDVYVIETRRRPPTAGRSTTRTGSRPTQAISEEVAADTSYALQQVTAVGTGTNANVDRPAGRRQDRHRDRRRAATCGRRGSSATPRSSSTAVMYSRGNGNEPLDGYLDTFYGGEHPARTWAGGHERGRSRARRSSSSPTPANLEQTAEGHEPHRRRSSPRPPTPSSRRRRRRPSRADQRAPTEEPTPTADAVADADARADAASRRRARPDAVADAEPRRRSRRPTAAAEPAEATGRSARAGTGARVACAG